MHLTMRTRTYFSVAALLVLGFAGATNASAKQGSMLSGDYAGKGSGIKVNVTVDDSGDGKAQFSMKASCGTVKGAVPLDATSTGLKGKRVAGNKTTTVRVTDEDDGDITGSVRYTAIDSDDSVCKGKKTFVGSLDFGSSETLKELTGRYAGEGDDGGLPISFDVAMNKADGALEVRNMSFQTDTECWNDLDGDGADDTLVANISGLSGEVDSDGYFEVDYAPDDDNEFYVEGVLEDGEAELYVEVGGFFNTDGTPQADGPLECDSWGEDYFAAKNG